jgi:hypothetical protein
MVLIRSAPFFARATTFLSLSAGTATEQYERMSASFMMILLVVQDKTIMSPNDPEHHVIAEAISTFHDDSRKCIDLDLPPLPCGTIPSCVLRREDISCLLYLKIEGSA